MNADPLAIEANRRLLERRKTFRLIRPEDAKPAQTPEAQAGPEPMITRLLDLAQEAVAFRKAWEAWAAGKLHAVPCSVHPDSYRAVDPPASVEASRGAGKMVLVYAECARCRAVMETPRSWIVRAGVPLDLADATLDNWEPRCDTDRVALSQVREFTRQRCGMLVILGGWGLGKTHLAVGVMQHLHMGHFTTQADLLSRMRAHHYHGAIMEDPEERARRTKLLVLDEIGLSSGGKDELPLLHGILSHRHGNYLPTVMTGNISQAEVVQVLGERVADRMSQSLSRMIVLRGESRRKALRERYGKPRA